MAVYFISQTANPTLVKIGTTDKLDKRLQAIAAAFEGGIDLVAQCNGGAVIERFLHDLFDKDHSEGEWYKRSACMALVIERFAAQERHYGRRVQRASDAADEDLKIAINLLRRLLAALAGFNEGVAVAQERAFQLLQAASPLWTRRRVRALWEGTARRVEHYEIRTLESAITQAEEARLYRDEARRLEAKADWIEDDAPVARTEE